MSVKIRVRDFQSIEDATIEVSGLTVITGQNNTGKSAMIRAVQGVFTNPRGYKFVRHGRPHCTVDVTFQDGKTVTWEKGDGVNRYVVNGKKLDKVGQSVPLEVESLGVVPITAAGCELWPQFAPQFTGQVFLLDQPGSVLAESIADVTRVGVLNEALRNAQSDRRSLSAELKVRASHVARLEVQEAGFAGLDSVEEMVLQSEALHEQVRQQQKTLEDLRSLNEDYQQALGIVRELTPVLSVDIPSTDTVAKGLEDLTSLSDLSQRLDSASKVLGFLEPVAGISLPEDSSFVRAQKIATALGVMTDIREQLKTYQGFLHGVDADSVREPIPEVSDLVSAYATLNGYRQVRDQIRSRQSQVDQLSREIKSLTDLFEQSQKEVQDLLGQAGSCPICGNTAGANNGCEDPHSDRSVADSR